MKHLNLFHALLISTALAACGGGDPESSSSKPDNLLPDGFVPPVSSSSSSSSSASTIVNQTIPYHENFDNAVNTRGFFSADYKGLNTDSETSFYFATGGFLDELGNPSPTATSWITADANSKLQIGNGRFTLGQTRQEIGTTNANIETPTWGEFDLSRDYKISFCVVNTSGSGNFEIYVDNNSTSANESRYGAGNASRVMQVRADSLVAGQRHEVTVPAAAGGRLIGTATSFLQFRVSSGGATVIDDLVIEYAGEPHGLTLPACVAEASIAPEPETPPAIPQPSVVAGDQQIIVGWTSVGNQTTYEVLYNTADSVEGATAFSGNPVTGTSAIITDLVNETAYYVFVRATNAIGSSAYSPGISATPVPAVPSTGTPLPFTVNLALTKDAFFGTNDIAPAQTLTNFPGLPMNFIEGGGSGITLDDVAGTITIASGGRFTIGQVSVPAPVDTASTDTGVAGDLDLSQPYKIIIEVASAADLGNFQVYVDNNTTGSANSIHGANSRVLNRGAVDIADGDVIEIIMDGAERVGTANSFIQLRTDSSIGAEGIVISGLRIEPLGDPEPTVHWTAGALTLVGSADIAPAGSLSLNDETAVTLTATGGNLSSSAHQLFFAHQAVAESDFMFTARIASVTGATDAVGNSYRFGLMAISNLETAASYADLAAWADIGFYVSALDTLTGSRANTKTDGTRSRSDIAPLVVGNYVRIEILDDGDFKRVKRSYSTDGVTFTAANSTTDFKATSATDNWFVGFYAAPGANNLTIEFDNISIVPIVAP